jgi:hypothetical protein
VQLSVSPSAVAFAQSRGGTIYLWIDDTGLLHCSPKPPRAGTDSWKEKELDAVRVLAAPSIDPEGEWAIDVRRFPWRRLWAQSRYTPSRIDPARVV